MPLAISRDMCIYVYFIFYREVPMKILVSKALHSLLFLSTIHCDAKGGRTRGEFSQLLFTDRISVRLQQYFFVYSLSGMHPTFSISEQVWLLRLPQKACTTTALLCSVRIQTVAPPTFAVQRRKAYIGGLACLLACLPGTDIYFPLIIIWDIASKASRLPHTHT